MRILITGGDGYIAKSLGNLFKNTYDITAIGRNHFDLSDCIATSKFFQSRKFFDVVIHCAVVGGNRLEKDYTDVLDTNLRMYYSLLANREYYGKLLHFGSGAELYAKDTPYGLSKYIIRESILAKSGFYNLRVFGVFNESELDTRFIKASIKRYLKGELMEVYQNRYMDFIYLPDLAKIVEYYINNETLPKEVDCVYAEDTSLVDIANLINTLGDYQVDIKVGKDIGSNYTGNGQHYLPIKFVGLKQGIINTYNHLSKL